MEIMVAWLLGLLAIQVWFLVVAIRQFTACKKFAEHP